MPYPHWCTAGQRADSLFSHSHTGSQHPHRLASVDRPRAASFHAAAPRVRCTRPRPPLANKNHTSARCAIGVLRHIACLQHPHAHPPPLASPPLPEKSSDDGPFVSEDASRRGAASAEGVAKGAAARVGQQLVGGRTSELLGRYVCPPVHTEGAPTTQSRGGKGGGRGRRVMETRSRCEWVGRRVTRWVDRSAGLHGLGRWRWAEGGRSGAHLQRAMQCV